MPAAQAIGAGGRQSDPSWNAASIRCALWRGARQRADDHDRRQPLHPAGGAGALRQAPYAGAAGAIAALGSGGPILAYAGPAADSGSAYRDGDRPASRSIRRWSAGCNRPISRSGRRASAPGAGSTATATPPMSLVISVASSPGSMVASASGAPAWPAVTPMRPQQ